jgi:hypothetical protein
LALRGSLSDDGFLLPQEPYLIHIYPRHPNGFGIDNFYACSSQFSQAGEALAAPASRNGVLCRLRTNADRFTSEAKR